MKIHANVAFLDTEWVKDVRVECVSGKISRITRDVAPEADDETVDALLPALGNLHSHSFQRAMAGMTEFRAAGRESFWTWRDLMYRFLDQLTPDHVEAIAALTFMEMQEAGYAAVGEFHYVHHQSGGTPYDALTELSDRIFAAAQSAGIGLTHLPVLYTYGGVQQEPLAGGQMRFANDVDQFLRLTEACKTNVTALPDDSRVGIAPHSLRATSPADLARVLAATKFGPVHIHIAEQRKEVRDVEAALGKRPVDWLMDNVEIDTRWCLIHATHMTEGETIKLAQSGAIAGLCPITEANLGDGLFNGPTYLSHGGGFGLGSDSNVRVSLTEELRTLEYGQRLRDMVRNVMVVDDGSVGQTLYTGAAQGGARALGRDAGVIAEGKLADLMALDRDHPSLCTLDLGQILDGLCFAAPDNVVTDTWSAGRHMVRSGRHVARERILAAYKAAVSDLLAAI